MDVFNHSFWVYQNCCLYVLIHAYVHVKYLVQNNSFALNPSACQSHYANLALFCSHSFCCSCSPQKFTVAGGSQFIPSLNDITSNQDLQWLVQPSLIGPAGPSRPPRPPYPPVAGMRSFNPSPSQPHLYRPGVIRAAASSGSTTRRRNDDYVRICFVFSQQSVKLLFQKVGRYCARMSVDIWP